MNLRILSVLLLLTSCGRSADPAAREKELSYLRSVVPDDLLEFAHVEVPSAENIAILGEGATQHLGLHLIPGQKADGKATFFLDDMTQPVATATGPNMHNDF